MSDTPSKRDGDDRKPWEKRDSSERGPSRSPRQGSSAGRSGGRDDRRGSERKPSHRDAERASSSRDGERTPYRGDARRSSAPRDGQRRPYERRDGERKPYQRDGERKPYQRDGDRKPWENRGSASGRDGERRPYERRDGERKPSQRDGDRKPYQRDGERRPSQRDGQRKPYSRDGERRPYERRDGERKPYQQRDRDGERKPYARDGERKPWDKDGRGGRPRDGQKLWTREGRPARGDRDAYRQERELTEEEQRRRELRSVRPRHDDPLVPDDVTAKDLDRSARNELKTLTAENAEWVARHLAMAARLIDVDPELAHQHALSASRRAGRIAMVRETLGITAYAIGDFALALRELRTYRRIGGNDDQLALMVDSERGLGRPDKALELGRSVDRSTLPVDAQVALAIAMSGARLDLGQTERALEELEIPQLDPDTAYSYSADLFHAYADVLEDLGRDADSATWRARADRAAAAIAARDGSEDIIEVIEEEGDDTFAPTDFPDEPVDDAAELESGEDEPVDVDEPADSHDDAGAEE